MMTDFEKIIKGAEQVISEADLEKKLKSGCKLRVKLGVDPTSADLHLGHTVVLQKLRTFQDLGHTAILIIGNYTAMIGDPSGKNVTRPQLNQYEVQRNADTYIAQASKVLDSKNLEIKYNGDWFAKMKFEEVIKLHSFVTVQQMLQREDFKLRLNENVGVRLHEIHYPIMQAYDSVMLKADIELGGLDQLFNILLGRELQKNYAQEPQTAIFMPILEGTDGTEKMSKSLNNYIGINESADNIFGRVMSISDQLMEKYYNLLTDSDFDKKAHPMDEKKRLASILTTRFHDEKISKSAFSNFEARFSKDKNADWESVAITDLENQNLIFCVKIAFQKGYGIEKSNGEIRRLIKGGSIQLNKKKLSNHSEIINFSEGDILKLDKLHTVCLI